MHKLLVEETVVSSGTLPTSLLERHSDLVLVCSRDAGRLISLNRVARDFLGWRIEELEVAEWWRHLVTHECVDTFSTLAQRLVSHRRRGHNGNHEKPHWDSQSSDLSFRL